jgi:hypothetical protein
MKRLRHPWRRTEENESRVKKSQCLGANEGRLQACNRRLKKHKPSKLQKRLSRLLLGDGLAQGLQRRQKYRVLAAKK